MKRTSPALCFVFLLFSNLCYGQNRIGFFLFKDSVISTPIRLSSDDSLSVLRFYISDLQITKNKKVLWKDSVRHRLIDFEKGSFNQKSARILFPLNVLGDHVSFLLGVGEKTAARGIGEGDLDPIKGMYWTWQSGYINFKMEGVSSNSPSRKNKFLLHLGGYKKTLNTNQKVSLSIRNPDINISFDLNKFLYEINFKERHTIMSPCQAAVDLSLLAKACFYVH